MSASWRDVARPIVARVLAETEGQPESVVKRALRAAYPFGERAMHPYKIWLDEVARQTGRKQLSIVDKKRAADAVVSGQTSLIEDL